MINPASCVRLYSDEEGETYIKDIEFPMSEVDFAPPAPALHLSESVKASHFSWLRLPAGWTDEAHPSPQRQLMVVLSGELEGWTSKGDKRIFRAGDCILMEDTSGKGHGAKPLDGDALTIVIALE